MDTTIKEITFNSSGECNFCTNFLKQDDSIFQLDENQKEVSIKNLIRQIKKDGHKKKYDCIIGVSGGVDSSFVLHKAVELGLRPLAVHMDNGWNSELAQNNIANLVKGLQVDLFTYVIDWEEYKELMQAFFNSDVIDIELLYDNAMMAVNYQLAMKYRIKYILSGVNSSTEGVEMPKNWNWFKYDKMNIVSIVKTFSDIRIKTFPMIGTFDFIRYKLINKITWFSFLDYFDYKKDLALEILIEKYSYKPYPYKHYENIFTRLYQGYILPKKFGVDKRKLHLSTLILTNQIKRDLALTILSTDPYPSKLDLESDISYFLKKMGWSLNDFNEYISRSPVSHYNYLSEKKLWNFLILGQGAPGLYSYFKKAVKKYL
jgi:N-acetyl sugar amidotransferase